jgi:hypothetical protein
MNDTHVHHIAEHRLLAAGWRNPAELARVCDALHLRYLDFGDRLIGVVVGYLRACADAGSTPDLEGAERLLTKRGVSRAPGELYHILQEPLTPGDTLVDLALEVQRGADRRTDELCRSLTLDGFRTLRHAFNCADCIRCSQGKHSQPQLATVAPRAHNAWRLRYEPSNANN